ncbi:MAG: hypothetical protein V1790_18610 [Planctomycetota bacterium]
MLTQPTPQDRSTRWMIAGVTGLTLLGAAVRWRFLDQPMRYDEAYNYLNFSSHSPAFIVTHYVPNNHVLHTLMVWAVSRVVGTSPAALRLPAFVAGVLLIPATAWLGWRLTRSRAVALLSALAVCGSSALIEYSTNARGYSWLTLFTVLAAGLTLHLIATPRRRGLWMAWGVVGALGAFTVPLMVYPVAGLTAAMLLAAWVVAGQGAQRKETIRGLTIGLGVCGLLTTGLYFPIFITVGVGKLVGTGQMAYDILGAQIPTFGGMLGSTWELWTRDATPVWSAIFIGGCAAFVIHSLRQSSERGFVPVVVVLVATAMAGLMRAPLPARAWVMLLPLVLVCAVAGVSRLGSMLALSGERRGAKVPFATMVVVGIVSLPLLTVVRRPYLCAEPNGLVEVEQALEECKARGSDRCALVSRYTPATQYYMVQKGIRSLSLPTSPSTERVYIVADGNRPLEQLWHNGVEGFEAYAPPRLWRELTQSTVYVAERVPVQASAR